MNNSRPPHQVTPCKSCPFRKDCTRGWIGVERMEQILADNCFVCHETTNSSSKGRLQCAGHMIIKGDQNAFVFYAKSAGIPLNLRGKSLVFDSREDCVSHHKN